jgi:hypothetical protein
LEGLNEVEPGSKFSKKLNMYGANTLVTAEHRPAFNAERLGKEAKELERFREQLDVNRVYTNSQANNMANIPHKTKSQTNNEKSYFSDNHKSNIHHKEVLGSQGEKIMNSSDVSIKSLNNFKKELRKSPYLHTGNQPTVNNNRTEIEYSPLSVANGQHMSVLNKSNSSINNMEP